MVMIEPHTNKTDITNTKEKYNWCFITIKQLNESVSTVNNIYANQCVFNINCSSLLMTGSACSFYSTVSKSSVFSEAQYQSNIERPLEVSHAMGLMVKIQQIDEALSFTNNLQTNLCKITHVIRITILLFAFIASCMNFVMRVCN